MRAYAHKIDANQAEIVAALEAAGWSVLDLSAVGQGCPDLLASKGDDMFLMEIKNPATHGRLNKRQREWLAAWRGKPPLVAYTAREALAMVGAL